MFEKETETILRELCKSLNCISNGRYDEILEKLENSVDFLTDGELKRLEGILYIIDSRLSLELHPLPLVVKGTFVGIQIKISLRARMKDFTTGTDRICQYYDYLAVVRYPFRGPDEKSWLAKIRQLNKEVEDTKIRLQRLYTPSRRLSVIVGCEPKPKYQILDQLSDYILKNKLRYTNGDIKIDGDLKPFYSKNTVTVCENVMFDTLRENTLVSEAQVYLSALQGGILYAGNQNTKHTKFMQVNTGGTISKYLHWPLT
jgi:hypothetical protein